MKLRSKLRVGYTKNFAETFEKRNCFRSNCVIYRSPLSVRGLTTHLNYNFPQENDKKPPPPSS